MDEARASCALDISGRPFTLFEAELPPGSTGGFEHELTEEFFRALANAAKLTLHLRVEAGSNAHHMIEAAFKAFARALRQAVAIDPSETRRAEHEGDADRVSPLRRRASRDRGRRLRHGQPPLGREGARARRRARERQRGPRPTCARADGLVVPGVGAFPRAMEKPARAGPGRAAARARRGGHAGARHLPGPAAGVRPLQRARRRGRASASIAGEVHGAARGRAEAAAHRLERGRASPNRTRR